MPFQIKKVGEKYKLYRIKQKSFVNKEYNSKEAAIRAGKAMMRYRGEKPILKGNISLFWRKIVLQGLLITWLTKKLSTL